MVNRGPIAGGGGFDTTFTAFCIRCDRSTACRICRLEPPPTLNTSIIFNNKITTTPKNVRVASRRHIPRGCRTDYVQGLTDESKNLYEAYKQQYSSNPFDNRTMESGNLLLDKMTEEKRKIWEEVITSTNMTHNSRKAHQTLHV